jgi:hypothetical protein
MPLSAKTMLRGVSLISPEDEVGGKDNFIGRKTVEYSHSCERFGYDSYE